MDKMLVNVVKAKIAHKFLETFLMGEEMSVTLIASVPQERFHLCFTNILLIIFEPEWQIIIHVYNIIGSMNHNNKIVPYKMVRGL